MKIGFTLTCDEFLDANEARVGNASHDLTTVAVAVYILSALACLIFGLWTGFNSSPDPIQGTRSRAMGFATAGLLLLTGLPYLLQWRKRTDQRLSEKELREEFHQKWDDPREFEVDDQSWSYRSSSGQDVRPWHTFRGFWDLKTVVVIASEKDVYVLPKRAFRGEELTELSNRVASVIQRGVNESLFTADLKASAWDYTLGQASAQRWLHTTSGLILLGTAMAACLSLLVYQLVRRSSDEGWQSFMLQIAAILLLLFILVAPLAALKRYRKQAKSAPLIRASVGSEAIFLQTPTLYRLLKYDGVREYKESRHVLLFFYTDDHFEMLPKRGFEPKQLQMLRKLVSAKTSS